MKRNSFYSLGAMAVILLATSACTKSFEKYNTDNTGLPNGALTADFVNLGAYLKTAESSIINFSQGGDPNSYQLQQNLNADCFSGYFMSPTVFNGGQNNLNYALVTGWNGEPFKVGYLNVMKNIQNLKNSGVDTAFPVIWAVAKAVQVEAMSRVTDIYGPIPYTKVGIPGSGVPYDAQQDVYNTFFKELDTANASLQAFIASGQQLKFNFAQFDPIYGGNFTSWLHFVNSLRLRLAMHIVKADLTTAQAQAEKAMDPAQGGLITDNSGNTKVSIAGVGFTNPLVFITVNWGDIRANASLITFMAGYNDPRLPHYYDKSTDTSFPAQYVGIRLGSVTASNTKDDHEGYSTLNYKDGTPSFTLTTAPQLMTAAEVYFLRAEAALRNFNNAGGSVQSLYEQGITTSMSQWGVTPGAYLQDNTSKPGTYIDPKDVKDSVQALTNITIAWNDGATTDQKMERIITQKWIAMFPEGQEAWTEFRRTGYPKLLPAQFNLSGGTINTTDGVRRLPFPQNEYSANNTEVNKALGLLGGPDNGGTHVWWDKQ